LAHHNWTPDSFEARQFEQKLLRGEMIGFAASPNTFAAMIVLCGIIAAGAAVQRIVDKDEWGWPVAILTALPFAAWVMWFTHSNTALITPVLAMILLLVIGRVRARLAAHRKLIFAACVIAILICTAAIASYGILHGTLPTDSLRFRWRYWVASMRVWRNHPIVGVGWSNFPTYYLTVRLPEAAEEIRDPHNFFLRILIELGLVGAIVLIIWLLRASWEATTPILPPQSSNQRSSSGRWLTFRTIAGIAMTATAINVLASVDFSQDPNFVLLELFRRALFTGLLMLGYAVVTLRSSEQPLLDERPAPWILCSILIGLAIFLLHNTIDFSLFENGPLMVFMTLAGAALGMRTPVRYQTIKHKFAGSVAISLTAIAFVVALFEFVLPICVAEAHADTADNALRARDAPFAARELKRAMQTSPVSNFDYATRAAQAYMLIPTADSQPLEMLAHAIQADPMQPGSYLLRARFLLQRHKEQQQQIRDDFTQALRIDPNNVAVRIEFARVLEGFGDVAAAKQQYQRALEVNDKLDPAEPKRLSPVQREELLKKL
jgi:hypothetical protein